MSDATSPEGCAGCNPNEILPILEARDLDVQEIQVAHPGWEDVIVCKKCSRVWLLMPREDDTSKPVA